ncbi:MAG: patatin [Alphaproteobacteria bacterium]|nr:MAG: patatin [Alphaproteobacteria bacterium]
MKKRISLALQGGGALGAYTWGALDRLLEDERVEFAAASGSSAGAMCAVVLADGLHEGGREGARAKLKQFWEGVAQAGRTSPYRRTPMMAFLNGFMPGWSPESYMAIWADFAAKFASPYDFNPLNISPLKELLEELVDFERVRACDKIKLFIGATNVETGRIRVFEHGELTADHVMASACLPQMFQAVEIDGVPYWDGGYTGNPALFPLFQVEGSRDIVIVQTHPIEREGAPRTPTEITARVNEINFNSSLISELRAIEFVARLVDESRLPEGRYRKMLVHNVSEAQALTPLGLGVDLNTDLSFFNTLFETGRAAADRWLAEHFDALGERSTVDLAAMFGKAHAPDDTKPLR